MNQIPQDGFLRLNQIIGQPKATPPVPAIVPVSKATWYAGIKTGRYPAPVHIGGGRATFYRAADIRKLIESV